MSERRPRLKAQRECAIWLQKCLGLGWSRDQLDFLEVLWWKYHDDSGRLSPVSLSAPTE